LASFDVSRMILDRNKAKVGSAIPGSVADISQVSRHRLAVNTHLASVGVDALAFLQSDHQEGRYIRKRDGVAQIASGLSAHKRTRATLLSSGVFLGTESEFIAEEDEVGASAMISPRGGPLQMRSKS
jgi:hypothetical protein